MKYIICLLLFIFSGALINPQEPKYTNVTIRGYLEQSGIQITKIELSNDTVYITANDTVFYCINPTK